MFGSNYSLPYWILHVRKNLETGTIWTTQRKLQEIYSFFFLIQYTFQKKFYFPTYIESKLGEGSCYSCGKKEQQNFAANLIGVKTIEHQFASNVKEWQYIYSMHSLKWEDVHKIWVKVTEDLLLEYKNFPLESKDNWYETMGLYLDMFAAFKLRVDELRWGYGIMPITKKDGTHKERRHIHIVPGI